MGSNHHLSPPIPELMMGSFNVFRKYVATEVVGDHKTRQAKGDLGTKTCKGLPQI